MTHFHDSATPDPDGTGPGHRPSPDAPRGRPDVLTLVIGLVVCGVALLTLAALGGGAMWSIAQTVAPLALVAIGAVGIVFSQQRTPRPTASPPRPADRPTTNPPDQHQQQHPNPEE
ncbi:hypothetical protein ACQBAU_14705 [Propionibacteriaceae bacterium Y2011]|uniref:hypothetical protein n=1 Tax=Microlunatus sp. Y2014 TaxID=3418488 RepID=UPI003B4620C2